jgi:CopG family nickel-responsive transcriptional regulator
VLKEQKWDSSDATGRDRPLLDRIAEAWCTIGAMSNLVRLSFSLEQSLLKKLDGLQKKSRYTNRSELIRDMIRDRLVQVEWQENQEAVGTVTFVYNHHLPGLSQKLTHTQHDYHDLVLAATHVHLSHDLCVEVVLVKGLARRIQELLDALRRHKGVLHGALSLTSTGIHLA